MAKKLGLLDQILFGDWADRAAINRNAEDLSNVEAEVSALRTVVQRQAEDILRLRAMLTGLVDVVREKVSFSEVELEQAVQAAWTELAPPPPPTTRTDVHPYRGDPVELSEEEIAAAKALLKSAQDHHFSKRFSEARALYQQIVDQHPTTKQATTARQQLDNLRNT